MSGRADGFRLCWGDTHHNTYMGGKQDPPLAEVLAFARTHLDFYTGAYYTPLMKRIPLLAGGAGAAEGGTGHSFEKGVAAGAWLGFLDEGVKGPDQIAREWAVFQQVIAAAHEPSRFVAFPGYEWQGDGTWGDHNVIHRREGWGVETVPTLADLHARLRAIDALAIPHHTGYLPGIRAPRWSHEDERLSPFSELFSIHGCSETDEDWGNGLRRNSHMGPGSAGGTYQDGLDAGLHIGAIASTDNWKNMPGSWGQGLAACLARDLTRAGIWEAFRARRVYGVTGDRMDLEFTCNGAPMGAMLPFAAERRIAVAVRGWDAVDRIELLKNGRVVATHTHQGAWTAPGAGRRARYRFRLEAGWGPREGEIPVGDRRWTCEAELADGRFTGWSPCWVARGATVPALEGGRARFELTSLQSGVNNPFQGGVCLEMETAPGSVLTVRANGAEWRTTVEELARGSRLWWDRAACVAMLRAATGIELDQLQRGDPVAFQLAFKVKAHRAIPEAGYTARLDYTDTEPLERETHYRVRVEQRNGQRAWSSPIWVAAPEKAGR